MKKRIGILVSLGVGLMGPWASAQVTPEAFAAAAGEKAEAATAAGEFSVVGAAEGWKFLANELKHVAAGDFSAAAPEAGDDPAEVIIAYDKELKALGVRMVFVPVPPKANVYPEKLVAGADGGSVTATGPFLKKLADAGVEVVDLEEEFGKLKAAEPAKALYCAQDSHWSPYACEVVAGLLAAKVAGEDWVVAGGGGIEVGGEEVLSFHGDLLTDAEKGSWAKEELPVRKVAKGGEPVETDKASPVLVVGDSHTLVFNEGGEMHCRGGGLVDHLQAKLGMPVDRMANKGSGGHTPRMEIARRSVQEPGMWEGKKLLVWCFSAREFTRGQWKAGIPAKFVRK